MGYRIEYQQVKKVRGIEKRSSKMAALTALFGLLFLLLIYGLWPQGGETLRAIIIPGNPSVTVTALENFALELKNGTALSDAFYCFCDQVFQEANVDLD